MPYGTRGYGGSAVGDPFLGGLFKGIGKVAKFVGGVVPGPVGTVLRAGGGLLAGPQVIRPQVPMPQAPPFMQRPLAPPGGGRIPPGQRHLLPPEARPKRRRMNPLNPKALSRATRRLAAYQRRNKQVEKQLRKIAPPRRGPRRDLPRGHTHVR